MAITKDATKGWARPANAAEWTELLAGTGIPNPDSAWPCNEFAGNLADVIGSLTLTAGGTPLYAQSASGWAGLGIGGDDNTNDRFVAAAGVGPDPSGESQSWLYVMALQTEPTANRIWGGMNISSTTDSVRLLFAPSAGTNRLRLNVDSVNTDGSADHAAGDYVFQLLFDRGGSRAKAYSDLETLTGTYSGGVNDGTKGYGQACPIAVIMYIALWRDANAEGLSDGNIATIRSRIQSPPAGAAVTFVQLAPPPPPRGARVPFEMRGGTAFSGDPFKLVQLAGMPPPRLARSPIEVRAVGSLRPLSPPAAAVAPLITPNLVQIPRWPSRAVPRVVHRRPTFFGRPFPALLVVGVGPAGSATFVLDLEAGAKVTYSWLTDIGKAMDGLEQRACLGDAPKQSYKASAFLVDGDEREVRAALLLAAAAGDAFLLALPFEEVSIASDSSATTVPVSSTALLDWALPGQRVVVVGPDSIEVASGVVQSVSPTSIVLDVAPGAAGKANGRVMPVQAVYLQPRQVFARHPINVSHWRIDAIAAIFGFAGVDDMGVGATVDTFDGIPVYDERNDVDGPMDNTILTLGEIVDAGGLPVAIGDAEIVDELRTIRIRSSSIAVFQWFKAFIFTVKGSCIAFLRATWQPDLLFDSLPDASHIKVASSGELGAGNYLTYWNNSEAHGRLQLLKTDGSIQYVSVIDVGDNGDGTLTIEVAQVITGTISMISFLELCRLENDEVDVQWRGMIFESVLVARVVQQ